MLGKLSKMFNVQEVIAKKWGEVRDYNLVDDQTFDSVSTWCPQFARTGNISSCSPVRQNNIDQVIWDRQIRSRWSDLQKMAEGCPKTVVEEQGIAEEKKKDTIFCSLQGRPGDIAELHSHKTAVEILDVLDK